MNINTILTNFAQKELVLSYNDTERNKINTSIAHLESVLKSRLTNQVVEILRFGSYTRNTILPRKYDPNSDIDLMIVFDNDKLLTPETYRKKLLDVVSSAYPYSISQKDFPAVKLELNHIKFDLVPAYCQNYLFLGKIYYIPAKYSGWMQTTPNDINYKLQTENQRYGNNIIRNTIRLCKHWNASVNYPVESYTMEQNILNLSFWNANDLYNRFVYSLNEIAGRRPDVKQAINYIVEYCHRGDKDKQLQWLIKLLPGLNCSTNIK